MQIAEKELLPFCSSPRYNVTMKLCFCPVSYTHLDVYKRQVEAGLAAAQPSDRYQFLRQGYFCADNRDSKPGHLVFNRSVSLKDSYKPQ